MVIQVISSLFRKGNTNQEANKNYLCENFITKVPQYNLREKTLHFEVSESTNHSLSKKQQQKVGYIIKKKNALNSHNVLRESATWVMVQCMKGIVLVITDDDAFCWVNY